MAQGPSSTILVAIRITLRIRESKVRNPDPPDRRRFVLSDCISCSICYDVRSCTAKLSAPLMKHIPHAPDDKIFTRNLAV